MRNLIFLLMASALLLGCKPSKVVYAKYGRMKLSPGEISQFPVGGSEVLRFENCCAIESDAVFLNRVITNAQQQYEVFISVSESLLQSDFGVAQAADRRIDVKSVASAIIHDVKVNSYLLKKADYFIARFTYIETRSGLLVIYDIASKDQAFLEDILNRKESYIDEKIRL
jgi:hypothetical protein